VLEKLPQAHLEQHILLQLAHHKLRKAVHHHARCAIEDAGLDVREAPADGQMKGQEAPQNRAPVLITHARSRQLPLAQTEHAASATLLLRSKGCARKCWNACGWLGLHLSEAAPHSQGTPCLRDQMTHGVPLV